MSGLVGLAFTSPSIAVMVINRSVFRAHLYQNRPDDLHAFLQDSDDRLPIVIVDGVSSLRRLSTVQGVHCFLVNDDPLAIQEVAPDALLDAEFDPLFSGFNKKNITPEDLNQALSSPCAFSPEDSTDSKVNSLGENITFREVLSNVTQGRELGDDFVKNVCLYLVGALHRKSWVSRVQKPALALGVPVEKLAELEKFIETTHSAEMLWRAYFNHVEAGVPVEDCVAQTESDFEDLSLLISSLGTEKQKWVKNPKDKPLVVKKKRRVRKLNKSVLQGTSMTIAHNQGVPPGHFDLLSTLSRIDESTGSTKFSRAASAFICKLVDAKVLGQAKRRALSSGASADDVDAVLAFVKEDPVVEPLWKSFCYTSYYPGVAPLDAARKFDVPAAYLSTVLSYKPLALVFEWASWPEELE